MQPFFSQIFSKPVSRWYERAIVVVCAVVFIGNYINFSILKSVLLGLSLYAVFSISRFLYRVFQFFTNATYANAIILSREAIAEISSNKRLPANDKEKMMEQVTTLCNLLQVVFTKKTRSNCSVSIKVSILNSPVSADSELKDLCIDYKHQFLSASNEDLKQKYTVKGNTAFQVAVSNILYYKVPFYYLNNNIPKTRNYQSSSQSAHPHKKLAKKSEFVYPLIPLPAQSNPIENEKVEIWGFLCIESDRKNSFRNRFDVPLVAGVANRLLDILMRISILTPEKRS